VQVKLKLYEEGSVVRPFARAGVKLGVEVRQGGYPAWAQEGRKAGERGQEEIMFVASVPGQECAPVGGEKVSCASCVEQAIVVNATTIILAVAPELVRGDG